MTSTQIHILQSGYGYVDEKDVYHASATCTLILTEDLKIIVDPGGAWEKERIIEKLEELSLTVDDIDVVVGTHGHSDHIGNLNLFQHAKQIVGYDINTGDVYETHDFKQGLPYVLLKDKVVVIPTPGHMHNDVSVVIYNVDGLGTVAICGDLFEKENDNGIWQEVSECLELQEENRKKMFALCDYIIPGHGAMFKNCGKN